MLERARWTGKRKLAAGKWEVTKQSGVCPENSVAPMEELGRAGELQQATRASESPEGARGKRRAQEGQGRATRAALAHTMR
jgi:hypothetical protein